MTRHSDHRNPARRSPIRCGASRLFERWLCGAAIALALLAFPSDIAFAQATKKPAKEKRSKAAAEAEALAFSHTRGFYEQPFDLTLGSADAPGEIRYTLDGSAPSKTKGLAYSRPVAIRQTSVLRAALIGADGGVRASVTHTFLFPADIVRQSPDGFPPPGFPIQWGENRVDYGMDQDVVNDPAYREEIIPALKSLPSFSLVMDLNDLFGERRGIYANSSESGRDAERPCSLELIHPDGRPGFQIDCGVRIRGGFSSMSFNPKHAFRFFFRKEYGKAKLKFPLFGPAAAQDFDAFDLRCAQNYSWSLAGDPRGLFLRDQFNRDLQLAMDHPAARGDFCHLYINGQYWGLFNTCERPEASFAAAYFGGKKEDYDVVKTGGVGGRRGFGGAVAATDGNLEAWTRLITAAKADLSSNAAYFKLLGRRPDGSPDPSLEVLLDPVNLIDYMLVIFYGGNLDAPISRFMGNRGPNNWHAIRKRTDRDGFRFFVWDAEHTFLDPEEDRTGPFPGESQPENSSPQWLYQQCLDNAEFRQLLADRIYRHCFNDGLLTPKHVVARFNKRVKEIESAVVCESARWGDANPGGGFGGGPPRPVRATPDGLEKPAPLTRDKEWRAEVHRLLNEYLPQRSEILIYQLWRQGLVSDLTPPQFSHPSGRLASGAQLSLAAGDGKVYCTTDGTDPRLVGGKLNPTAQTYTGPLTIAATTTLKARLLAGDEWSPLAEARYETR
ncbi:MAG: CotH kinase family protein [Verrucomicrobia bacterium]|nr:CotH kinase family protein [Verrucomicrobiota bacterium]